MTKPANRNYAFSDAFAEELARSGLRHACICPGSRSTPLVMSLARQPRIKVWVHLDERSGSYFGLGMSRAINEPVAVVSTSGTAAANFLPAVVEAHYSHVPLLIVTADRPTELWEWGANQTIDQPRMYGNHAKWSISMAAPEATVDLLRYVREMACRLLSTAIQSPAGPVHVNMPFGEPLVPQTVPRDISIASPLLHSDWERRESNAAYTHVETGRRSISPDEIKRMTSGLKSLGRGIIVCGPQYDHSFPAAVSKLAARLGFPILADPLSQVRCGRHDRALVVDSYDAFLRSQKVVQSLEPELILRFGATPTSKNLQNYLAHYQKARQLLVHESDWQDPMHVATDMVQTDPTQFATEFANAVSPSYSEGWVKRWFAVAEATRTTIVERLRQIDELFEGKIFTELSALIPSKANLFAGNSMPVRDLDAFYPSSSQDIHFIGNRGASGIDGVVSSSLGVSAVAKEPTVSVLGDVSFYHDMNGLLAAKLYGLHATFIVVNNNGGGIFSFLPQREYPETFEKYFATPHGLTFQSAASLYSLSYSKADSWNEFRGSVSKSIGLPGTAIVELQTDRVRNFQLHRDMSASASKAAETKLTELT